MEKEKEILYRHLLDLSRLSSQKGILTYSNFLNQNEQGIVLSHKNDFPSTFQLSGGYELAERRMIAFLPDFLYHEITYPFVCCQISPLNEKSAEDLSHRDVLGSLMSLGIERCKIGDILVQGNSIFLFCHAHIFPYIQEQLTKIRHTLVSVRILEVLPENIGPVLEEAYCIVASNRLDNVVHGVCHVSRSQSSELIKKGMVFVNSETVYQTSYSMKEQDILSIRGYGRFRFEGCIGETKKGRVKIKYQKYT